MLTIVTLHLKRERHTRRFVESLYAHTKIPFELVIVSQDTNPTARSFLEEISSGRPNLKLIWNERNVGIAAGRNQGLRAGSGRIAAVVDNDVEFTDGWLPPLLSSIESSPAIGAVGSMILTAQGFPQYCSHYMVERNDSHSQKSLGLYFDRWFRADDPMINQECEVAWYPTTCLLVRRSSFDQVGGFDDGYNIAEEDKDFSLALRRAGFRVLYNPVSRVVHHGYPRDPEYAKFRENLMLLCRDRQRFEDKWSCSVVNESSRQFLAKSGISDEQIARYERFPLFMKVVP